MKKRLYLTVFVLSIGFVVFAGGEAETGRSQAVDEVAAGQLLPVGAVDPANYLQDFAFRKKQYIGSAAFIRHGFTAEICLEKR